MTKAKWLAVGVALIAIGAFLMFFPFNPVEAECAPPGATATSGFVDEEKGCPTTIESQRKVSDEASRFKVERVGGLVLIVAGLGVGIVGLVRRKKPTQP